MANMSIIFSSGMSCFFLLYCSAAGTEPPRKKRRSKWDIQAPDAANFQSATPTSIAPSDAAMAAAAKLNAMLAAQGKLVKSATPPLLVSMQSHVLYFSKCPDLLLLCPYTYKAIPYRPDSQVIEIVWE